MGRSGNGLNGKWLSGRGLSRSSAKGERNYLVRRGRQDTELGRRWAADGEAEMRWQRCNHAASMLRRKHVASVLRAGCKRAGSATTLLRGVATLLRGVATPLRCVATLLRGGGDGRESTGTATNAHGTQLLVSATEKRAAAVQPIAPMRPNGTLGGSGGSGQFG